MSRFKMSRLDREPERERRAPRATEQESSHAGDDRSARNSSAPTLGATAPGRSTKETADFILDAHRQATSPKANAALPRDPTAKMIAAFAQGRAEQQPREEQLTDTADMILRADAWRQGKDPL